MEGSTLSLHSMEVVAFWKRISYVREAASQSASVHIPFTVEAVAGSTTFEVWKQREVSELICGMTLSAVPLRNVRLVGVMIGP